MNVVYQPPSGSRAKFFGRDGTEGHATGELVVLDDDDDVDEDDV